MNVNVLFLVLKRFHSRWSSVPAVQVLLIREDVGMGKYDKKQNCNVSRHVSVSRQSRETIFQSFGVLSVSKVQSLDLVSVSAP